MATRLNITNNDEFPLGDIGEQKDNGTWTKSQGGTERMYQRLMKELPKDLTDQFQIICSRVRDIDETKHKILWCHDTYDDPESSHLTNKEKREKFDKIVFVSNYQLSTYNMGLGLPYDKGLVLKNAIDPMDPKLINKPDPKEQVRLIYHTTPHRGLELLIPSFNWLCERHENIHLDVFSSFEIYGWGYRDEQYKKVIDACKEHQHITYHGFQPHDKVMEALGKAHIFAFPSIWPETSCIAVLEAMSAKAVTVCPNLAALPETCANFASMYQYSENPQEHANRFANVCNATITNLRNMTETWEPQLNFQKNYFDNFYNWKMRSLEWKALLEGIIREKANKKDK